MQKFFKNQTFFLKMGPDIYFWTTFTEIAEGRHHKTAVIFIACLKRELVALQLVLGVFRNHNFARFLQILAR